MKIHIKFQNYKDCPGTIMLSRDSFISNLENSAPGQQQSCEKTATLLPGMTGNHVNRP